MLMYAIESKDVGVVKYILNRAGLDQARDLINSRNKDGNTSMHIMAGLKNISPGDHVSLGCVLLKYGGLQIRNRENEMTPADFNGPLVSWFCLLLLCLFFVFCWVLLLLIYLVKDLRSEMSSISGNTPIEDETGYAIQPISCNVTSICKFSSVTPLSEYMLYILSLL